MNTLIKEEQKIKIGDIMVCVWGYSMILTDWVEVVKETPKTLVVEELQSKSVSGVIDGLNYTPDYGRPWVMPTGDRKHIMGNHGAPKKIRLYKREGSGYWFSKKGGYIKLYNVWDGRPIQEDHND